jgi:hypothetical protein
LCDGGSADANGDHIGSVLAGANAVAGCTAAVAAGTRTLASGVTSCSNEFYSFPAFDVVHWDAGLLIDYDNSNSVKAKFTFDENVDRLNFLRKFYGEDSDGKVDMYEQDKASAFDFSLQNCQKACDQVGDRCLGFTINTTPSDYSATAGANVADKTNLMSPAKDSLRDFHKRVTPRHYSRATTFNNWARGTCGDATDIANGNTVSQTAAGACVHDGAGGYMHGKQCSIIYGTMGSGEEDGSIDYTDAGNADLGYDCFQACVSLASDGVVPDFSANGFSLERGCGIHCCQDYEANHVVTETIGGKTYNSITPVASKADCKTRNDKVWPIQKRLRVDQILTGTNTSLADRLCKKYTAGTNSTNNNMYLGI